MNNIKNNITDIGLKNEYGLSKSLCFLLVIFSAALIVRLYYIPLDLPLVLDSQSQFWYANDMSILKIIPPEYNSHNNLWHSFLSLFFSMTTSNNILDYMNIQRILSTTISALTIFPIFFLCKKFFSNKYSLLGSSFFIFDPRLIMNSLQGIIEPLYFIIGIFIILFSLSKSKNFYYISFGLAAIFTLTRYEGLLILIPLTVTYFWKFKINKKSIITYSICIIIFLSVLFPMVDARFQATGEDGIISHFVSGQKLISNTVAGNELGNDRFDIKNGLVNSISFLVLITIPTWIIFLPYGIFQYFQKFDQKKCILLLFSIILILPALYAYSRDFQETRYLYILFPLFSIISLYSIEKINKVKKFKIIFILIIFGIIISSIIWVEYKWIDEEYEKEVFTLSFKVKELTKVTNAFYPESTYLQFVDLDEKFPKLKNEIIDERKLMGISQYNTIEELLLEGREQGLTHLVIDQSQKQDNFRKQFLIEIFQNENKYDFLKKIYDSNNEGFNYKLKIFEIDYNLFNQYIGINKIN
jgi:hypothetical protein